MGDEPRHSMQLPTDLQGMPAEKVALWDALKEQADNPALSMRKRLLAKQRMVLMEAERRSDRANESIAVQDGIEESVWLHEGRGDQVTFKRNGGVIVESHRPLLQLLRGGKITPDQEQAGIAMVDYYEARRRGIGSQLGHFREVGGGHDNDRMVWSMVQLAKKTKRVEMIEREVAMKCRDPAALQMMRWVCDRGESVRAMGGGRAYERHCIALSAALQVADAIIRGQ